jgi:hypothetical protein
VSHALPWVLTLALGVLLASHLMIAARLLRVRPRWRAPVALLVPPLAPYWAWREGMLRLVWAWVAGLAVYAAAVFAAAAS